MGLNVLSRLDAGLPAILLRYMLTVGVALGLTGCTYWPAVRESYGQRVRVLDGAVAVPTKLIVVRAKVMKLRYPHRAWVSIAPPDTDDDSEISAPVNPHCNTIVNSEPDSDDGPYIPSRIFVTAMAYLKNYFWKNSASYRCPIHRTGSRQRSDSGVLPDRRANGDVAVHAGRTTL